MWAPHTVPSVAKYPHGSTWTTPSSHTLAARMDVCVHSLSHTHTHICSKVSEMPREPPDEKTPPHKQHLLSQGEALLFGGTMSVLTFLCLHIFKQQKQQKEWKTRSQTGMQPQPPTCSDWYKLPIHISISNNFLFNNHARESDWPAAYLMKIYLSVQPQSRILATSHTQEAFHSVATMMTCSQSYLKVLMKLTSGGVKQSVCSPIRFGTTGTMWQ